MIDLTAAGIGSVLAIGAHADDIEIGCGATLLALREQHPSLRLTWLVMTGDAGRREEAARSSGAFPGGSAPALICGGLRDGFLPYQDAVEGKELIHRVRDEVRPDLVLTHRRGDMHQDHRFCGEVAHQAFRGTMVLEYEIPKLDGDLATPNLYVPLTQAAAERKVDHLMRHFASQRGKGWFTPETFTGLMRLRGIESGAAEGWAEGFHARKLTWRP